MTMPSRIECEEAIARLMEYLDGELDGVVRRQMEEHLETCRECFDRAEFERRLRERLKETGSTPPPESLRRRIRRLVDGF